MAKRVTAWGMILVVMIVAVACKEEPEPGDDEESGEPEPEIVTVEPLVEYDDEEGDEVVDPGVVQFRAMWPEDANYETFDLMWLGADREIALREEPREDAPVVVSASWPGGTELEWTETRIRVENPRRLESSEYFEVTATPYDPEFGELEVRDRTYEIEEGEPLFAYRYDGRGGCYFGVGEEIVYGECPDEHVRGGEETSDIRRRWSADTSEWWVEVSSDDRDGWFRVEEAPVEVHPREVEGLEEFEGPPGEEFRE